MDSHQRRKRNRTARREFEGIASKDAFVSPKRPSPIVTSSHNLGDSLAILGLVVAILCWIWVPSLTEKAIAILVCAGMVIYLSYRSHWTRNVTINYRSFVAAILAILILVVGGVQLYAQYRYLPLLSLKAFVSPYYAKGYVVGGLKWPQDNIQAVTVVVGSVSEYPVRDIDLTVQVLDKSDDILFGMGQLSNIPSVTFSPPEFPDMMLQLHEKDGKVYDISSRDLIAQSGGPPFGGYWKAFCPTLPEGVELRLVLAAVNTKDQSAPNRLRMFGSYEAISKDGSKTIKFDETLAVTR